MHLPWLVGAALAKEAVHALQHVSFLFAALLFWWSVLGTTTRKAQGIALVSIYEWYAGRALEGEAYGVADALIAASEPVVFGGPAEKPLYFAVDSDVAGRQVAAYFKGVAWVIGLARVGGLGRSTY